MKTARKEITQSTLRRSLVMLAAASKARGSLTAALNQRERPAGLTDAEWACVLVRDSSPGTPEWLAAIALACEAADRMT